MEIDSNVPEWALVQNSPLENVRGITQRAVDVYLLSKKADGEVDGIGWWQSANGYTAIALHDAYSSMTNNCEVVATAIRECERRRPGLINEFNDDTLWWGLCCLHVFSLDRDAWFLARAREIWRHVVDSNSIIGTATVYFRGLDMDGACYWTTKPDEEQINSITTGLFAELSLRLALLLDAQPEDTISKARYIHAAKRSVGWILRCRYRENEAVVLDNILLKRQEAQDWTFTYTTGVTLGACALTFVITEHEEYLTLACTMAREAMQRRDWVEENGVLTEHGAYGKGNHEPWQNSDAVGFKAVLIRQLATLYGVIVRSTLPSHVAQETAALIERFITVNFKSQQERNTNGNGQYGPWWNGPFEMPTSHSQMAVLDLMAAAALVNAT